MGLALYTAPPTTDPNLPSSLPLSYQVGLRPSSSSESQQRRLGFTKEAQLRLPREYCNIHYPILASTPERKGRLPSYNDPVERNGRRLWLQRSRDIRHSHAWKADQREALQLARCHPDELPLSFDSWRERRGPPQTSSSRLAILATTPEQKGRPPSYHDPEESKGRRLWPLRSRDIRHSHAWRWDKNEALHLARCHPDELPLSFDSWRDRRPRSSSRPPSLERQDAFRDARTSQTCVKRREDNGGDNSWRAGFSREDAADDAELYRLGLLYDDEDGYERGAGFGLGAMPLAACAVVTTDRRRRRRPVRTTVPRKETRPPSESSSMQLNSQYCLHLSLDLSFAALREDYALAPFLVASETTNSPDTHAPEQPATEYQLQAQCTAKKSDQMEVESQPDTVHEKETEVEPQPLTVAPQQHRPLSSVDFKFTNLEDNARTDDEDDSALLCPKQVNAVASLHPDSRGVGVPEVEDTARQIAPDPDEDDWMILAQDNEKEEDEDMILDADDALSSNTDDHTELESHGWWWWADRNDGS